MNKALFIRVAQFAGVFFPLHVLPPVLSDASFTASASDLLRQAVGLAYHLGFTLGAMTVLIVCPPAYMDQVIKRRAWVVAAMCALSLLFLSSEISRQIASRLLYGCGGAVLLAAFYRDLQKDGTYEQLPWVFGLAALVLESSGLFVGLLVEQFGVMPALRLSSVLMTCALTAGLFGSTKTHSEVVKISDYLRATVNLSGSWVFMVTAILAYAGFFLMLLALSSLSAMDNGPQVSGLAIFSTAFAFSAGNLLPFERVPMFGDMRKLVAMGASISLVGSVMLWSAISGHVATGIVLGTAMVAFGNGITVSRCFQNASLASSDGYSGPLLTMVGVMLSTMGLSSAGRWIENGASLVQVVAFGLAFAVVFWGSLYARRRADF